MTRPAAALIASLLLCGTSAAQSDVGSRIEAIFAEDGIDVHPGASREVDGGEEFRYVGIGVTGHVGADGWFRSGEVVEVGPLRVLGDTLLLPTMSFPLRFTTVALQRGRIEGMEWSEGGVMDQSFDRLSFEPVAMSKEDGVFVSMDRLVAAPDPEGCFAVDMEGFAVSVERTMPELARTGEEIYKGDARLEVDCVDGNWVLTRLSMEADGWGRFTVTGEVSFDPRAMLAAIVEGRAELDPLFSGNAGAVRIIPAEIAFYTDLAALVELGDLRFEFSDDGFATAVREALPAVAGMPGGVEALVPHLLGRVVPGDVAARLSGAVAAVVRNGGSVTVDLDVPDDATVATLVSGGIAADAWAAVADAP